MIKNVKSITLSYRDYDNTSVKEEEWQEVHSKIKKLLREKGYNVREKFNSTEKINESSDSNPYFGANIQEREITFEDAIDICKTINEKIPNIVIENFSFGTTLNSFNWLEYETLDLTINIEK